MIENQLNVGTRSLRDEIAMRVLIAERARRAICSAAALTSQHGGMTAVDIPLDLECAGAYRVADEMLKARGDTPCAQPNTIEVRLDNAGIDIQPDKRPMSCDVAEELRALAPAREDIALAQFDLEEVWSLALHLEGRGRSFEEAIQLAMEARRQLYRESKANVSATRPAPHA